MSGRKEGEGWKRVQLLKVVVELERLENSRIASAKTFGEILLINLCQEICPEECSE